jgi:hypothetical protein
MVRVRACWAEGLGIRATARVFAVDPNPVLPWWVEAADQLEAFARSVLWDGPVHQVQLDELSAVLRAVPDGALREAAAIKRLERSPGWGGTAMDPESQRRLVRDVGTRTLALASCVVQQVGQGLAPGGVPLLLTDGSQDDCTAILSQFGTWIQLERQPGQGPAPPPRWMPLPGLLYTQVIKTVRRRRGVRVSHRVVLGTLEAVHAVWAKHGWQLNTAFVERLHLAIRQRVAAVGRRVTTRCQGEDGVRQQLVGFHSSHNVCLPPAR